MLTSARELIPEEPRAEGNDVNHCGAHAGEAETIWTAKHCRSLPHAGDYDLVVAGGGMAGVGAACAAAR